MPGTLPGFAGLAAFAGIKFVGYSLAALGLKKLEPSITASVTKIAAARTGLGFVLGPFATILLTFLAGRIFFRSGYSPYLGSPAVEDMAIYGVLFIVRIFVWALVLFLFTKKMPLPRLRFWLYALSGAIVSSLLDWPGYALAIAAPGKMAFC